MTAYFEHRNESGAAVQGRPPFDGQFYLIRVEQKPSQWFRAQWTSLGWQTPQGEIVDKVIDWDSQSW